MREALDVVDASQRRIAVALARAAAAIQADHDFVTPLWLTVTDTGREPSEPDAATLSDDQVVAMALGLCES